MSMCGPSLTRAGIILRKTEKAFGCKKQMDKKSMEILRAGILIYRNAYDIMLIGKKK